MSVQPLIVSLIVAITAIQRVIAVFARHFIVAGFSIDQVVAGAPLRESFPAFTVDIVVGRATIRDIIAAAGGDGIKPVSAAQTVVTSLTSDRVITCQPVEPIPVVLGTLDDVRASRSVDGH